MEKWCRPINIWYPDLWQQYIWFLNSTCWFLIVIVIKVASVGQLTPCIFLFQNMKFFMYLFLLLLPAAGAGLTGSKMARRVGGVDEFEFKAIGENHNQGVGFDIFHIPVFLWHSLLKLSCDLCFCVCMCELCLAFLVVSNNTSALGYYFKLDSCWTSSCRG